MTKVTSFQARLKAPEKQLVLACQMTSARRDLMLRIYDGEEQVLRVLYRMQGLTRLDEVLSWLVEARLTGKNLLAWMRIQHENSLLKTVSFILMRVNNDKAVQPLFIGKDWKQ